MSTNKDLFKEAIADAKQVREAALANAKAALEEALSPRLQSMISAKLQEMDLEEDEMDEIDFMQPDDTSDEQQNIGFGSVEQGRSGRGDTPGVKFEGDGDLEEDFDLSAILAELEDEDDSLKEAKDEDEKDEMKEAKEDEEDEESEDEESEETEEEPSEEAEKVTDLTVTQLEDLIRSVISAELEAEEYETPGDEEAEVGGEEEMAMDMGDLGDGEEEEVNLEELLAELDALDENKDEDDDMYEAKKNKKEDKDEMKEAIKTINALRNELNETNLLNAKLLYVNKIFKSKNLTESQKLKVIASFDKATTPAQAKELFESIKSSNFGTIKKTQIKESLGFASKAAGVAPKSTIVEPNAVIARMQKLANIY